MVNAPPASGCNGYAGVEFDFIVRINGFEHHPMVGMLYPFRHVFGEEQGIFYCSESGYGFAENVPATKFYQFCCHGDSRLKVLKHPCITSMCVSRHRLRDGGYISSIIFIAFMLCTKALCRNAIKVFLFFLVFEFIVPIMLFKIFIPIIVEVIVGFFFDEIGIFRFGIKVFR